MIDEEEYTRWMGQARHTLDSARGDLERGDYDWACFKAHQAAEYALKALLRGLGREAYGHSLHHLLSRLGEIGFEIGEIASEARRLDRHYLAARYPNQWVEGMPREYYEEGDALKALEGAERIIGVVEGWLRRLRSG